MPFSNLYGKITDFRNRLYEREFFKSYSLGAPTISVGNITVGGTGKTPLVAFVAEVLAAKGEQVCIISRGYKRENPKKRILVSDGENIPADARTAGDEPFELARKLSGKAVVIADADRVAAAEWARGRFGITAFVLDDAFQHLRARRDLDIVTIDATNPFGNGRTLPFGILREPLKNLKRADLIVITRANLVSTEELSNLNSQLLTLTACPIFTAANRIARLTALTDFHKIPNPESQIPNSKFFAFCALGNPGNFFAQLNGENFEITATKIFPDHHFYSAGDIAKIEAEARKSGASMLVTTAKDAVKLTASDFTMPCYVVENTLIFDDEKTLCEKIYAVCSSSDPKSEIRNPKSA